MSRQHHYLKCETEFFQQAVELGDKNFELRKNDRDFKIYDIVYLEETVKGIKTGRVTDGFEITYVLKDYAGLEPGYCIFCWRN
ncbi:MAG: DUF3850 domain-containing protein [Deltaproteobacteria bacterium]|nr:DUF3850 domain-containing protein [Deltaproteobacteria bacterium]